jgi:hypothetical protein
VGYRLNPPPGWPPVPDGFVPPAGWRPDPSWPAPPPGWQLWVPDDLFSPAPAPSSAAPYPSAQPPGFAGRPPYAGASPGPASPFDATATRQTGATAAYQTGATSPFGPSAAYQTGPTPAYQTGPTPAYQTGPSAAYQTGGPSPYNAAPPYQTSAAPYPFSEGVPPQDESMSRLAIASFVLGLLGGLLLTGVLSVILGVAALAEIRRTAKRGKALAIAGITLSGVWAATIIALFAVGAASGGGSPSAGTGSSGSAGHPASVSVFSLPVGTCFDNPAGNALGITSVTAIACTKAHDAQVFAEFDTTGGSFPGTTTLERRADTGCNARITGNLDESKITSTMSLHFIFPQQLAWDSGQRRISCLIVDSTPMTSSVLATP